MARSKKHQDCLIEQLKDHEEVVFYLNAALEESLKGDEESRQLFFISLLNVGEAQCGVGALAKKAHVGCESLYKTLSGTGNPKWHTIVFLCVAMGLSLRLS